MSLDLPIGVARFRDCYFKEWMGISNIIWKSIITDDASYLSGLVKVYFSGECGVDLLNEPIAMNINEKEQALEFKVPAFLAIESNAIEALREIIRITNNPNARSNPDNNKSITLIYAAAINGDSDTVRLLLDAGAKVDDIIETEDGDEFTALSAAIESKSEETVNVLLNAGACPTFISAVRAVQILPSVIGRLIEANPNLLSQRHAPSNATLTHFAAGQGNHKVLRFLVEKGADINSCDDNGCTPLSYAIALNHIEIISYLRNLSAREICMNNECVSRDTKPTKVTPSLQTDPASFSEHQKPTPLEPMMIIPGGTPGFIAWLSEQEMLSLSELRNRLISLDLLPSAVIDDINEKALDLTGELALLEDGEKVIVRREVLSQVVGDYSLGSA